MLYTHKQTETFPIRPQITKIHFLEPIRILMQFQLQIYFEAQFIGIGNLLIKLQANQQNLHSYSSYRSKQEHSLFSSHVDNSFYFCFFVSSALLFFYFFFLMEGKEDQWEGFQEFCQSNTAHDQNNKEQPKKQEQPVRAISADPSKQMQVIKQLPEQKPKTSPYKKNKVKVKIYEVSPKKQQLIDKLVPQEIIKPLNNNDAQSPPKQSVSLSKYERIPIMRKEDDFRYTGNILYRSFAPRSSDTFFRTLKEVDFAGPLSETKFKANQVYSFNSRIQSGNLGCVFQGRRV